jgi:single-stranded-DNA-specific exonuclease
MARIWHDPTPVHPSDALIAAVGGSAIAAAALMRRGITTPEAARAFIDPDLYTPASPFDLPDMPIAVERVRRALASGEPIAVWGDFDADGQTSAALLSSALDGRGAPIHIYIPDRAREGHGMFIAPLDRLIDAGVRLIITCDTGITAHEAIAHAGARGVDVIVTDHHHLTDTLPSALANINPQRLPAEHPMRTLPGVGAALQLIRALYDDAPDVIDPLLDLVALGIVADVAVQTGDTRFWLQRGLRTLRAGLRPGLAALAETAGLETGRIDEGHIAFTIAPRLNAAGRLDDAMRGVDLLLARDRDRAITLALHLENLNFQRRALVERIDADAESQIARQPELRQADVLILSGADWHPGVVGIVANRLAERYNVPVILLVTGEDGEARGSARSVDGVHITEALSRHADLLSSYGGHTMAAGLRLPVDRIPALRRALNRTIRAMRGTTSPDILHIDAAISLADLTLEQADALAQLAPFGAGNPPLVLGLSGVTLREARVIGRDESHRALTITDPTGATARVVWWESASLPLPGEGGTPFDLACTLRAGDYRGVRRVEVQYLDSRPTALPAGDAPASGMHIVDRRGAADPAALLLTDRAPGVLVWREGGDTIDGVTRAALTPAEALVVWTTPPDRALLRAAVAQVHPGKLIVYAVDPPATHGAGFRRRALGLLRYALESGGGSLDMAAFAAALATSMAAAQAALSWAVASGAVHRVREGQIARGDGAPLPDLAAADAALDAALAEVAAFRAWFRRADIARLLDRV